MGELVLTRPPDSLPLALNSWYFRAYFGLKYLCSDEGLRVKLSAGFLPLCNPTPLKCPFYHEISR